MREILLIFWGTVAVSACAPHPPIAVIPIEVVNGNPVTSALVGGDRIDLIVDTGGFGGLAIAPDELSRLNVEFTGTSVERTDAAGVPFESREFVVSELSLGESLIELVQGFERKNSASGFAGGEPINVLGRGFLHKFTVVIDYLNERIELYKASRGREICGPKTTSLVKNEDDQLVLPIRTDGGDMVALMDTGANYSFVQSNVVALRNLNTVDDFYTTKAMQIGDRDFGPLEMVVLPINGVPEIDALIGANFFSRHKICFDYRNLTVSFPD